MTTAKTILNRSHPKNRETEQLQSEFSRVWELLTEESPDFNTRDELETRARKIHRILEERLNAEYPECQHCGCPSWGQEYGDPLHCADCDRVPNEEITQDVHDEWERLQNERRYNVYKNGDLSETAKPMTEAKAEKLDGFTQYNPNALDGSGDFEQFRVEPVEEAEQ